MIAPASWGVYSTADPSGHGQGQRYLGSATLTTDAAGNASFAVDLQSVTSAGEWISATATDASGNTLLRGTVAWYKAEGNANDAFGDNNGAIHGGVTFGPSKVGQAFNFTASSGYVQIPDAASLNPTNALTIDAWVYFSGLGNYMIVGKDDQSSQRQFLLSVSPEGHFRPCVGITNGTFYYLDSATTVAK